MKPRRDPKGRTTPTRSSLAAVAALALLALGGCGGDDEPEQQQSSTGKPSGTLTYATWGGEYTDALRSSMLTPFAKETGVKVETPSAPGEFVPKLQAQAQAGQVEWDLIDPGEDDVPVLIQQGLLQKLPDDLKQYLVEKVGEENVTDYGVSFAAYSDVIACNPKVAERCPTNPQEFWDVKGFPGRRAMYGDGWNTNIPYALEADGVPGDQVFPEPDVDRAFEKLDQIKPHVNVWWKTGDQSQQILRDEEVAMAIMWDGRAYQLQDQGLKDLKVSHDGMLALRELMVVPEDAPNPQAAFAFLRWYVSHPEAGAKWIEEIRYGVADPKALDEVPEKVAEQIATAPENEKVTTPLDAAWSAKARQDVLTAWTNWLGE
jgi:spermidine/putrescine-binding protein